MKKYIQSAERKTKVFIQPTWFRLKMKTKRVYIYPCLLRNQGYKINTQEPGDFNKIFQ